MMCVKSSVPFQALISLETIISTRRNSQPAPCGKNPLQNGKPRAGVFPVDDDSSLSPALCISLDIFFYPQCIAQKFDPASHSVWIRQWHSDYCLCAPNMCVSILSNAPYSHTYSIHTKIDADFIIYNVYLHTLIYSSIVTPRPRHIANKFVIFISPDSPHHNELLFNENWLMKVADILCT